MAPLFEVQGVSGPRGLRLVHDISFSLDAGQVLHVVGESGSGKTTLLRLLARLDPRSDGRLWLRGQTAEEIERRLWRRRVALVFQEPRLFPGTIEENLVWAARHHGIAVDASDLLDAVGLRLPLERDVQGLSGGEAKRLQLARSLAVRPDVLLLDEPTASLDAESAGTIRRLVQRLADEGLGVVYVSHDVQDQRAVPGPSLRLNAGNAQMSTEVR